MTTASHAHCRKLAIMYYLPNANFLAQTHRIQMTSEISRLNVTVIAMTYLESSTLSGTYANH